jgi:hypothetical protein
MSTRTMTAPQGVRPFGGCVIEGAVSAGVPGAAAGAEAS